MTKITMFYTTDEQKANLRKLADYLESLPEDYEEFDMEQFFYDGSGDPLDENEISYVKGNKPVSCGTVACAVGHGPAAGIPFDDNDWWYSSFSGQLLTDWGAYSTKFVNSATTEDFDWLFAGQWQYVDNHHWGAAARIRFFLEHGGAPVDFHVANLHGYNSEKIKSLYEPYRKK